MGVCSFVCVYSGPFWGLKDRFFLGLYGKSLETRSSVAVSDLIVILGGLCGSSDVGWGCQFVAVVVTPTKRWIGCTQLDGGCSLIWPFFPYTIRFESFCPRGGRCDVLPDPMASMLLPWHSTLRPGQTAASPATNFSPKSVYS